MSFGVEDFHDLVRLLEARPEWRAELRRLVLSDELLALPEQLAQFRTETERRFQELVEAQRNTEARLADLAVTVRNLAVDVARLSVDVGELKGDVLETRYRRRAHSYFGRLVRRAHVLSDQEMADLVDEAAERGQITEAEREEVLLSDVVIRGRLREDPRPEVYLLVEVSWGVGPDDVRRAVRRASMLAKLGTQALPVVAGKTLTAEAAAVAREHGVWQVLDGQVLAPEPMA